MRVFTVTLNTAIDAAVSEEDYQESGLSKARLIPAGKGINVSRALVSSRVPSTAIAIVGEEDRELFESLETPAFSTRFVVTPGKTRTNTTIVSTQDGIEHHERCQGFTAGDTEYGKVYDIIMNEVMEGDWIIFSGSLPEGMKSDTYASLIRFCKSRGAVTVLDTSGAALLAGIQASPDIIKPNKEELESLLGEKIPMRKMGSSLKKLCEVNGIRLALVSLGAEGAVMYQTEEQRLYTSPALPLKIPLVSTVGCGDSCTAGLVAGFLDKKDPETALQYAMTFANLNLYTEVPGELIWENTESSGSSSEPIPIKK